MIPQGIAGRPALALDGISKTFQVGARAIPALRDVSLQIGHGQVTGLIGPDGAGKTTLMRLAAGLIAADAGTLSVLGIDVARDPLAVQSAIGYMPQRFGLYEDLTVQENLALYADLQGVPHRLRPARYTELLRMVGLAPFTTRLAGRLSGGMKQKLGLACTLVSPPRLLLLDEPTVGVDPVSRRELWSIVYRLVREQGTSVLLSTAYLDEAERCDAVILLHQGRLLGQGAPAEFSGPLAGHSYRLTADLPKRHLQMLVAQLPDVIDAIIEGESVRIVSRGAAPPDLSALDATAPGLVLQAVSPTFEDAFVARLRSTQTLAADVTVLPIGSAGRRSASPAEAVISVHQVKRRFGAFYAVKGVSFEVRQGEVFGLIGANGAGKSTTFRMLCGLLPASEGSLRVAGHDLRRAAAQARARIGYMAQRFSLYEHLSVRQNLQFFANAYSLPRARRAARIQWALLGFDLADYADLHSGDLSLGYKQRLALAAALMHDPDILFLDEPTSGVDPLARREFWQRINLLAESGVTVLVTTHFMDEANYCDRLLIMAEGETLAQGTPAEMKARFRTADLPEPTMEDAFIGLIQQRAAGAVA